MAIASMLKFLLTPRWLSIILLIIASLAFIGIIAVAPIWIAVLVISAILILAIAKKI